MITIFRPCPPPGARLGERLRREGSGRWRWPFRMPGPGPRRCCPS